jgi:hypothetical protein
MADHDNVFAFDQFAQSLSRKQTLWSLAEINIQGDAVAIVNAGAFCFVGV